MTLKSENDPTPMVKMVVCGTCTENTWYGFTCALYVMVDRYQRYRFEERKAAAEIANTNRGNREIRLVDGNYGRGTSHNLR